MNGIRTAQIISAFAAGLFFGLMFTFIVVIQRMLVPLSASDYTRIMQNLIHGADNPPLVPMVVVVGMVAPLYPLFHLRHATHSMTWKLTLWGWLVFLVGVFTVTMIINVPINNQIVKWNIQSPPANWQEIRDRWNAISYLRTPAAGISFVLFMLSLLHPLPEKNHS